MSWRQVRPWEIASAPQQTPMQRLYGEFLVSRFCGYSLMILTDRVESLGYTPAMRRGGLVRSVLGLLLIGAVVYGVVALLDPWALHMGGRPTPFLMWTGVGKLVTKGGMQYPIYLSLYPSSHFSRLHMDGLRPVGGLQGTGWLCTSRGVTQRLELSGTIYGQWRTTDGNLVGIRLLEPRVIDVGQGRGFFDLYGPWQGPQLVMDSRTSVPNRFRSGFMMEHPSVRLDWGSKADFDAACAAR